MIDGSHVIVFSTDAAADREFLARVLGQPHVDAGNGWLIVRLPPAELAVHPAEAPSHELYLMCDDLDQTMRDLEGQGVELTQGVTEERWGRVTRIRLPGGGDIGLYEPRHPRATELR